MTLKTRPSRRIFVRVKINSPITICGKPNVRGFEEVQFKRPKIYFTSRITFDKE